MFNWLLDPTDDVTCCEHSTTKTTLRKGLLGRLGFKNSVTQTCSNTATHAEEWGLQTYNLCKDHLYERMV
jgi:hypothetical protein